MAQSRSFLNCCSSILWLLRHSFCPSPFRCFVGTCLVDLKKLGMERGISIPLQWVSYNTMSQNSFHFWSIYLILNWKEVFSKCLQISHSTEGKISENIQISVTTKISLKRHDAVDINKMATKFSP